MGILDAREGIDTVSTTKLQIRGELVISETRFDRPIPAHMMPSAIHLGMARPIFRGDNLILDIGLEAFAAMTGGGVENPVVGGTPVTPLDFGDLRVFEMQLTDVASPTVPGDADTALEGTAIWTGNTDGPPNVDALLVVSYPALGQVRFGLTVPQPVLTDKTFTEEGIFAKNGKLIARTTFNKPHPVTFGIQFDHTIAFERVP